MPDDFIDDGSLEFPPEADADGGGQKRFDTHVADAPAARATRELAARIRYWHRQRQFAMNQRKAADNALAAFLRTQLGWSLALPKSEQKAIAERAQALIAIGEKVFRQMAKAEGKRKPVEGAGDAQYIEWSEVIGAAVAARKPFDEIEAKAKREMEKLAMKTPAWPWAEPIKGFGPCALAQIIGESNLSSCDKNAPAIDGNYPNPAKLWKRMGVAVMDGTRQGGLTKAARKEDWIAHGYNRERRSILYNIGTALVKLNDGEYRALYDSRKQFERDKAEAAGLTVAPAAKIPKAKKDEYRSLGQIERRARRYMEKRLLRDLWRAWRGAGNRVAPGRALPPANSLPAGKADD